MLSYKNCVCSASVCVFFFYPPPSNSTNLQLHLISNLCCVSCWCVALVCVPSHKPCAVRCAWSPRWCAACLALSPVPPARPPGWQWPSSASCAARLGSAGGTAPPPRPGRRTAASDGAAEVKSASFRQTDDCLSAFQNAKVNTFFWFFISHRF